MAPKSYPWKRYWTDWDNSAAFAGYDLLPDSESLLFVGPPVQPLAELRDVPLLVLLGQPGLGKTTAIQEEIRALRKEGRPTHYEELQGIDSGTMLQEELNDSPALAAWRSGAELFLFIDGLDRALVALSTIQRVLAGALQGPAADMVRLRVRIACRSADWDDSVRDRLADLWPRGAGEGDERSLTLELLGLTYADVRVAARAEGLDPDAVLTEIATQGAQALAAIPITLTMVLEAIRSDGVIGDRAQLYARAIRMLLAEHEPLLAREQQDELGPNEVVALAARQAAALLLCNRAAITMADPPLATDVPIVELLGGTEPIARSEPSAPPGRSRAHTADSRTVVVERQPMRAIQRTGLMVVDNQLRSSFRHQTFAEYLCAVWLASGRLNGKQIEALILNPHDPERQLLSHLRDVAGWLAVLDRGAFGMLIATQADVLLRGDLAMLEPDARSQLVTALFERAAKERIDRGDRRIRRNLGRLGHPGLADQIRAVVAAPGAALDVRVLAITLAEENRVISLGPGLANIALSDDEPLPVRASATRAVSAMGDEDLRRRLVPLATEPVEGDVHDELKGAALEAVWPAVIDTAALLSSLTAPKRRSFFGSYQLFLSRAHERVPDDDLPLALRWAAAQPHAALATDPVVDFIDELVRRAWARVERDDVADALADLIAVRLASHRDIIGRGLGRRAERPPILEDAAGRRRIIERLVGRFADGSLHPRWLPHTRPAVLRGEDVEWLCALVLDDPDKDRRATWADLVEAVFWPEYCPVNVVLQAAERSPELADRLTFWLRPVRLDSEEARAGRERHAVAQDPEDDQDDVERTDVDAELGRLIDEGKAGDDDAWWRLNVWLVPDADGRIGKTSELEARVTQMPGWARASDESRRAMIDLAAAYVARRHAEVDQWLRNDGKSGWRPARAGFRALVLLAETRPQAFDELTGERWSAWAAAVVDYPRFSDTDADLDVRVLRRLGDRAPDALAEAAIALVRAEDAAGTESLITIRHIVPVLNVGQLQAGLRDLAHDSTLRETTRLALFGALLEAHVPGIVDDAVTALSAAIERGHETLASGLLTSLLRRQPAASWAAVWPLFEQHREIARTAIFDLAQYESFAPAADLPEDAMADLYLWLEREFPHDDDPDDDGFVSTRQQVGWWRDRLLQILSQRRTPSAVAATRRIAAELPHLEYLRQVARSAETAYAEELWSPPSPRHVVELATSPERRLVQSEAQLQAVVVESLERANERLQGEWPKAWQLWNDRPLQPKGEERLSDWIKDWLDDDLARRLVTSREPQVRPTVRGSGLGARNDLRVELPAEGNTAALAVIIEVKRYWHPKVFTGMRTQLVDDYLTSAGVWHGIYVVGYYSAPKWARSGTKTAAKRTLEEWRVTLANRAKVLATETGRHIEPVVLDLTLRTDRAS